MSRSSDGVLARLVAFLLWPQDGESAQNIVPGSKAKERKPAKGLSLRFKSP